MHVLEPAAGQLELPGRRHRDAADITGGHACAAIPSAAKPATAKPATAAPRSLAHGTSQVGAFSDPAHLIWKTTLS